MRPEVQIAYTELQAIEFGRIALAISALDDQRRALTYVGTDWEADTSYMAQYEALSAQIEALLLEQSANCPLYIALLIEREDMCNEVPQAEWDNNVWAQKPV